MLAVGGTILLVNELRPYYRQISEVMRPQPRRSRLFGFERRRRVADLEFIGLASRAAGRPVHCTSMPRGSAARPGSSATFDLSAFDAGAFDALDAGMASFDAGFDASVGDGGGGDGGGGGGGGGGGD